MPHSRAKLLRDILDAGEAIQRFVNGKRLEDYRADLLVRSAVERQFEILGEAVNRLGRLDPAVVEHLGPSKQIVAFRNIIAHGYDALDDEIVWQVIHEYLPRLLESANSLLGEMET